MTIGKNWKGRQLISVKDVLVPTFEFSYRETMSEIPRMVKHKMNERKRLLNCNRIKDTYEKRQIIKWLNIVRTL